MGESRTAGGRTRRGRVPGSPGRALLLAAAAAALSACAAASRPSRPGPWDLEEPPEAPPAAVPREPPREKGPVELAKEAVDRRRLDQAEAILREALRGDPGDHGAGFLLAKVLLWQGRREECMEECDRLLVLFPGDPDVRLIKAYALWYEGRGAEARPILEAIVAGAPDYEEAHRLLLRVLEESRDGAALAKARVVVAMRFAGREHEFYPGPVGLRPGEAPRRGEIEAGFSYERLSGGRDPWTEEYLDALLRYGAYRGPGPLVPRETMDLRLRRAVRFDEADWGAAGWLSAPLDRSWTAGLGGEINPGAEVLPLWKMEVAGARALGGGWVVQGNASRTRYEEDDVGAVGATAEKYAGPWRAAATARLTRLLGGGNAPGGSATLDWFYGIEQRSRLGATTGFGQEIENTDSGLQRTHVFSVSVHGRHWFDEEWALTWDLWVHVQGSLYTRTGILLGIRHAF